MTASVNDVPLHPIDAAHVRSHFGTMEVGVADAPEPDEPLRILAMTAGSHLHTRTGGPKAADISHRDRQP